MKSIVVFCGSANGYSELYKEAAYELGAILAERQIDVIYGGAKVGLMGALADGALNNSGRIIGVIPDFLKTKEVAHESLTKLEMVDSMHARKLRMHELSDGIIAMPGGWGTMEELFEMMTWGQLGLHQKPIGILNVNGFYDAFNAIVSSMVSEGFLKEVYQEMLLVSPDPLELLDMMENYTPPEITKWIDKEEV